MTRFHETSFVVLTFIIRNSTFIIRHFFAPLPSSRLRMMRSQPKAVDEYYSHGHAAKHEQGSSQPFVLVDDHLRDRDHEQNHRHLEPHHAAKTPTGVKPAGNRVRLEEMAVAPEQQERRDDIAHVEQ